jgi:hypothetical protein
MKRRRLLPDDAGVVWDDGNTRVLWAYRSSSIDLGDDRVERVDPEGRRLVLTQGDTVLEPMAVYVYRQIGVTHGAVLEASNVS